MFSYEHWKCCGYKGGAGWICDPWIVRQVVLRVTSSWGRSSFPIWAAAALCHSRSHSVSCQATAVLMGTTGTTPPGALQWTWTALLSPSSSTAPEGNYWGFPIERMVEEINIFSLFSNISFDIFQFFFQNKTQKKYWSEAVSEIFSYVFSLTNVGFILIFPEQYKPYCYRKKKKKSARGAKCCGSVSHYGMQESCVCTALWEDCTRFNLAFWSWILSCAAQVDHHVRARAILL